MNEDKHPLYDIESNWQYKEGSKGIQVFEHKEYKDLLRVIDFEKQTIHFTDRKRIVPEKILDINKNLPLLRKIRLMMLLLRVIDAEKPIKMPYIPEQLKVYVEDSGEYVAILYYMDSDEEKSLIPIKRYFKLDGYTPMEINFDMYNAFKEEQEDENNDGE